MSCPNLCHRLLALATVILTASAGAATPRQVVETYADIGHAVYEDSLIAARAMQQEIDALLAAPSEETLASARRAWIEARIPYQQSEAFRFGNAIVDGWEAQLNAWPLDEGLIDYVGGGYQPQLGNPGGQLNIIANESVRVGRTTIDLRELTPELLASLNELAGSEANVATGYHAVEFLLWGQDLNGTGAGAGSRPYTDYLTGEGCTHGHCARRAEYLRHVTTLLIEDLEYMVGQWAPGDDDNYRAELLVLEPSRALQRMIFGMGSLALGELAGERMKVALQANSPEDEHDCFSDNTHNSHFYNALGIRNLYLGEYTRIDGTTVGGASLAGLTAEENGEVDERFRAALDDTRAALDEMVRAAEHGMRFDQMLAEGNERGHAIVNGAIEALVAETEALVRVATTVGIERLEPDDADHEF